jgi:ribosome-associated translation inhibitor RaiA
VIIEININVNGTKFGVHKTEATSQDSSASIDEAITILDREINRLMRMMEASK